MARIVSVALALAATAAVVVAVNAQNLPLPELGYAYDALEPWIDEATMRVHHLKHHRGYTDRLNDVLMELRSQPQHKGLAKLGIDALLGRLRAVPGHYATPLRNFGGGYVNHAFFWKCLAPPMPATAQPPASVTASADGVAATPDAAGAAAAAAAAVPVPRPSGALGAAIDATYGSFEQFQKLFAQSAVSLFGSGWTWLVLTDSENVVRTAHQKRSGSGRPTLPLALMLTTTQNQDSPLMQQQIPVLALDVWEHAYYLQHQNKRDQYVNAFWRVVNWRFAEAEFDRAQTAAAARVASGQAAVEVPAAEAEAEPKTEL